MRVAVVGLGSVGTRHARNLMAMGHEVIGYDANKELSIPVGVKYTASLENLYGYANLQAVIICTPPASHVQLAIEALSHDCHVFIEKPLATSLNACLPLRIYAHDREQQGIINMVACNWRYFEGVKKMKQAIDSGILHKPYNFTIWHYSDVRQWHSNSDWRQSYAVSKEQGGVTMEVGWHLVDLSQYLLGPAILRRKTIMPSTELDGDVDAYMELALQHDHANSLVAAHFAYDRYDMGIEVVGSKQEHLTWAWADLADAQAAIDAMYVEQMQHFLACCEQGKPSDNPIEKAVETLKILLEAKSGG